MHILYIHIYIYKGMSQTLLAPLNFEACHSKIVEWNSKVLDFFKTKGPPLWSCEVCNHAFPHTLDLPVGGLSEGGQACQGRSHGICSRHPLIHLAHPLRPCPWPSTVSSSWPEISGCSIS